MVKGIFRWFNTGHQLLSEGAAKLPHDTCVQYKSVGVPFNRFVLHTLRCTPHPVETLRITTIGDTLIKEREGGGGGGRNIWRGEQYKEILEGVRGDIERER